MISLIKNTRRNIRPPYLSSKFLVIESDDWGAECIDNQYTYQALLRKGIPLDKDPYSIYDSIASKEDLETFFNVLLSVKDYRGNHPIITANVNLGNPDFTKIKDSHFEGFYWIPLDETLNKHSSKESLINLWRKAIVNKVFHPQLHGREHLNVSPWMAALRNGIKEVRTAFDYSVFNIKVSHPVGNRHDYRAALDFEFLKEINFHKVALNEAAEEFLRIFGFQSKSIIAPCYTWCGAHEKIFNDIGIKLIQGAANFKEPRGFLNPYRIHRKSFLSRSPFNQFYLSRNVFFEPSQSNWSDNKVIDTALRQVQNAFWFGKPAIVSFHRLNIIGSRVSKNSERNLKLLHIFLHKVIRKWPMTQFKTTTDLL